MSSFVIVGKKLIPREQVALIEPYDPEANPRLRTARDFRARIVMVNRDSVLTEETVEGFAKAFGFRLLPEDGVATSPVVRFQVESFTPAEGFAPNKPYATRLRWRDLDGNDQSKLLIGKPEDVLAIAVRGETEAKTPAEPAAAARRSRRRNPASAPQT